MNEYFNCLPRANVSWRIHGILGFVAAGAAFFLGDLFGGSGEDDNEVDPDSGTGTIGDDELTGDNSNILLNGEAGNDILDGAGGDTLLVGRDDLDPAAAVVEDFNGAEDFLSVVYFANYETDPDLELLATTNTETGAVTLSFDGVELVILTDPANFDLADVQFSVS